MNRVPENKALKYELHGSEVFGPSVELILRLHRHLEDLVFFGSQRPNPDGENGVLPVNTMPGQYGRHGAITVGELRSMFPQFIDELCRDAYFTVHGFLEPRKEGCRVTRRAPYVSHLNAVFADMDFHKDGTSDITPNIAAGMVLDLVAEGQLPPPSFFSFSGRGVWAFWILRHPDNIDKAPAAYREPKELWKAITEELQRIIAENRPELGVDGASSDLARYTRVPGSINTKSGRPVRYLFPADDEGRGYLYTIGELADFFGVDTRPRITKAKRTRNGKPLKKPARGGLRTWEIRLEEFYRLIDHRSGPRLRDGQRRRLTLFWYAFLLRHVNATETDAWSEVLHLAEHCDPPISEKSAHRQFHDGWKLIEQKHKGRRKGVRNSVIAQQLDITPHEVEHLDLKHLRPDFKPKERPKSTRTQDRRNALVKLIKEIEGEGAELPTTRELAEQLDGRGYKTSHDTVARDLKTLGIAHSKARRKMRRKQVEKDRQPLSLFDPEAGA